MNNSDIFQLKIMIPDKKCFCRTRWNAETLLPKEGLDSLLLHQQTVAIGYGWKFDTCVGCVGVVIGSDGCVVIDVVAGVSFIEGVGIVVGIATVTDFAGFAAFGITGIVFFVGLDGVGLVGVAVSLVGVGASGVVVSVGGVGDVNVVGDV